MSIRAYQLYSQEDPKIYSYETSYLAEQSLNLLENNQQIIFSIINNRTVLKNLDPRAGTLKILLKDKNLG